MGDITDRVLDFVIDTTFTDLPAIGIERVISAIGDGVAVGFAGTATEVVVRLRETYEKLGLLNGEYPLLGTRHRSNALDAAEFNGVAIHAMDYDDSIHPGPIHSSCVLLPSLLAVSQMEGVSGKDLISAFLVGLEFEAKLALRINPNHTRHGWHATGTIGASGSALAVAKLLRLDREQVEMALGNAASGSCGLRANFGTMTKPLHAGAAAHVGLFAALLARDGFTASRGILDGDVGYLAVYGEPKEDADRYFEELGDKWEIATEFGLGLKTYPCCGEAAAAVEAALAHHEHGINSDSIAKVVVATNARAMGLLTYPDPKDLEQARFSMEFCVAAPLTTGRGDLATFSEEVLHSAEVQRLIGLVDHVISPEHRDEHEFGAIVDVTLDDGTHHEIAVPLAPGWASRFMTEQQQRNKFQDCCDLATGGKSKELFELLHHLPELEDMRVITNWLSENVVA